MEKDEGMWDLMGFEVLFIYTNAATTKTTQDKIVLIRDCFIFYTCMKLYAMDHMYTER